MGQGKYKPAAIISALKEAQGMIYVAARKLKCSPQTIYTYAERYPKVQEAIDNERGYFLDTTEIALQRAVLAGEGWAIAFALRTIGKHRGYVEKQEIEHSGTESLFDPLITALEKAYGDRKKQSAKND